MVTKRQNLWKQFATCFVAPGVFEKLHYLMGMEDCLINFTRNPNQ